MGRVRVDASGHGISEQDSLIRFSKIKTYPTAGASSNLAARQVTGGQPNASRARPRYAYPCRDVRAALTRVRSERTIRPYSLGVQS